MPHIAHHYQPALPLLHVCVDAPDLPSNAYHHYTVAPCWLLSGFCHTALRCSQAVLSPEVTAVKT